MGIKHLGMIEDYLKSQNGPVTRTAIRLALNINPDTVWECLRFFLSWGLIKMVKVKVRGTGDGTGYVWTGTPRVTKRKR